MTQRQVNGVSDLEPIARGGTSVVYRGTQQAFGRTVAVKILDVSIRDPDQQRRFERECRAIGSLSGHPNVVTVHDAGLTTDGHPYLVMEFLPRSLADVVADTGPLRWTQAVALGTAIASALGAAHAQGVLHRDVKPQNILMAGDVPKLTDFGLARYAGTVESQTSSVTASFTHASPELVQGKPVDERSDVYSLASTLHEAMTGSPPFVRAGDESLVPIISRIVTEPPPSLGRHGVPAAVEDVVVAAMAKDPAKRPASVAAFAEQLAAAARTAGDATAVLPGLADTITFQRHKTPDTRPTERRRAPTERPEPRGIAHGREPAKRRRSLFVAVGAVAVLGIAGIAWASNRTTDDEGGGEAGTTSATTTPPTATSETTATATTAGPTVTIATTIVTTIAATTTPTSPPTTGAPPLPEPFEVSFDLGDATTSIAGALTADDLDTLKSAVGLLTLAPATDGVDALDGASPDGGATAEVAQQLLIAMQNHLTDGTLGFDGETFQVSGQYATDEKRSSFEAALLLIVDEASVVVDPVDLQQAPNSAPRLSLQDRSNDERQSVDVTLSATDADGDRLSYEVSGLPAGLSTSGSRITGSISSDAASVTTNKSSIKSKSFTVTVKVSDGTTSTAGTFTWRVRDTHTRMPNWIGKYGDEMAPYPLNFLLSNFTFGEVCNAGNPNIIWHQPIAPNTVVKWGMSAGTFYYGDDGNPGSDCTPNIDQGW